MMPMNVGMLKQINTGAQIAEEDARKLREKRQLKESLERKERERYWTQYCNDPDSVKICPYGWSPFGFYL